MKWTSTVFILLFSGYTNLAISQTKPASNTVSGYYDTLYMPASTFKALPNDKYIFVTFVTSDGHLSLQGWQAFGLHGRRFGSTPAISPISGYRSPVAFGPNSNFADVIVNKKGIRSIKKTLRDSGHAYVMLVPTLSEGLFIYRVFTGNTRPGPLLPGQQESMAKKERAAETNIFLNPSPPKQFY